MHVIVTLVALTEFSLSSLRDTLGYRSIFYTDIKNHDIHFVFQKDTKHFIETDSITIT